MSTIVCVKLVIVSGAMDSFARGLKNAAKLIEDGTLDSLVKVSSKALLHGSVGPYKISQ